jgi:hypothetical protein
MDPTYKFSLICRQHKDLHERIRTFNLIAFNLMRGKAKLTISAHRYTTQDRDGWKERAENSPNQ